jgi:hypothetical protein
MCYIKLERCKQNSSILSKLEYGWEKVIRIHNDKYEGNPLCNVGAIA